MLGGFAQAALRAVINISKLTGTQQAGKLFSPHFLDKPKVQIGCIKVFLIARA